MQQSRFFSFSLLFLFFLMFVSCDTEDPFRFEPPDLSTVPDPYDTSNVESVEIEEGVTAYTHDEGYGQFQITIRDQVDLYLTLRTESGEIIYSTFSSDRVDPIPISMPIADGKSTGVHQTINQTPGNYTIFLAYTPGFKKALVGMREGGQRTLVLSPEKGYNNIPTNVVNQSYKDSTLIYDIRVSKIDFTQKQ